MDTVDTSLSQQSIGNNMSRDDDESRNDDIFKDGNTSRKAMNCGRCWNCIIGGRCGILSRDKNDKTSRNDKNRSRDDDSVLRSDDNILKSDDNIKSRYNDDEMSREDKNVSRNDNDMSGDDNTMSSDDNMSSNDNTSRDDRMSRDELVQAPPPASAPSFPDPKDHSCSICTFSTANPSGLKVHEFRMENSPRGDNEILSDEQICFIWHHLYLGWRGCFMARPKEIFERYANRRSTVLQADFNYSLHQKGYEIRKGRLYVQRRSYSAFDLSKIQYSWINKEGKPRRSRIYKRVEKRKYNKTNRVTTSEEELQFIYHHKVDLGMTWARTYAVFLAEFPQHAKRTLFSITNSYYRTFPRNDGVEGI